MIDRKLSNSASSQLQSRLGFDEILFWLTITLLGLGVVMVFSSSIALAENSVLSGGCLLYTSPSPRDKRQSRMPSSA